MHPASRTLALLAILSCFISPNASDWPQWRGPSGQGICSETGLPTHWGTNQNIRWVVPLPDRGNSTPIISGQVLFMTQAIEKENKRLLLAIDRHSGKLLWQAGTQYAGKESTHETNPFCSASPVTDGSRVIASFGSAGVYCYDFEGKELWHRDLGPQLHAWGNAASPILYRNLCILNVGPGERSFLVAMDKQTGRTVWQHDEPGSPPEKYVGSWSTPVVATVDKLDQLLMTFPERILAFNPASGKELWSCAGLNPLVYTSPLHSDGVAVALGGFNGSALAVKMGGTGDVTKTHRLWLIPKTKQRIGSGVISDGHVYILNDPGIAECFELKTGKLVWEERLKGPGAKPDNWSSLVLSEKKLYAINQSGDAFVFKASPAFGVIATNTLGELTRASIAVSDRNLFIRTYNHLWCVAAGR